METNKLSNDSNKQENDKQYYYSMLKKYWWILLIVLLVIIIIIYSIFSRFYCSCPNKYNLPYDTRQLDKTINDISKLSTNYFNKHVVDSGENILNNVRYIHDINNQFHFMTDNDTGMIYINKVFE